MSMPVSPAVPAPTPKSTPQSGPTVSTPSELEGIEPRPLKSIGVIGGGTMGAGIATSALLAQMQVVLIETGQAQADAARDRIVGNLQGALKRGKLTEAQFDALSTSALTVATEYDSLRTPIW